MTQAIEVDAPSASLAAEATRLVLDAERESGAWVRAQGFLVGDAFLVLRESTAFADEEPGSGQQLGDAERDLRIQLMRDGGLARDGDICVFLRDYLFSSPAAAASTILGRPANGWREWRDRRGNRPASALGLARTR